MFEHSIPVPRLYRAAAKITENVNKNKDSVKNLVYQTKHPNTKALYALVVETLRHDKQLEFLFKRTKLLEQESRFNPWLAKVLVTELLWGKKRLAGESKPVKTILAYQQVLNAHVCDVLENQTTINKATRPRFVRVNTILVSVKDAVDGFRSEGWTLVQYFEKEYDGFLNRMSNLSDNEFMMDIHIPELLIFPPNTEFYAHDAYKNGLIILQDKASCLPVHLLNPTPGASVLDMCAAPGMKTSHLAAKLNNKGKIYAVDLDTKRLKTLENIMEKIGVTCVETINKDILHITNNDCQDVEYILVDPSCSGSGIVDRIDLSTVKNSERIQKLKGFQIMVLKHALRKFPKAKRVIYSTCSVYPEENEEVIKEVLMQTAYFKLVNASDLLKGPWINFGADKYNEIGHFCLYSKTDTDMTNGFFVAIFERLNEGEENKYYAQNTNLECAKYNKPNLKNSEIEADISKTTNCKKKKKGKLSETLPSEFTSRNIEGIKENVENDEGKNKRNKKRKLDVSNSDTIHNNVGDIHNKTKEKRKKHKSNQESKEKTDDCNRHTTSDNIRDRQNRTKENNDENQNDGGNKKNKDDFCDPNTINDDIDDIQTRIKKKKTKRHSDRKEGSKNTENRCDPNTINDDIDDVQRRIKKKKKKRNSDRKEDSKNIENRFNQNNPEVHNENNLKRKRKNKENINEQNMPKEKIKNEVKSICTGEDKKSKCKNSDNHDVQTSSVELNLEDIGKISKKKHSLFADTSFNRNDKQSMNHLVSYRTSDTVKLNVEEDQSNEEVPLTSNNNNKSMELCASKETKKKQKHKIGVDPNEHYIRINENSEKISPNHHGEKHMKIKNKKKHVQDSQDDETNFDKNIRNIKRSKNNLIDDYTVEKIIVESPYQKIKKKHKKDVDKVDENNIVEQVNDCLKKKKRKRC